MGWKNLSYGLKGGIIGIIISLIFIIIGFITEIPEPFNYINIIGYVAVFIPFLLGLCTERAGVTEIVNTCAIAVYALYFFIYFFVGAFIGWIIGKLKSKKQPQNFNHKEVNQK